MERMVDLSIYKPCLVMKVDRQNPMATRAVFARNVSRRKRAKLLPNTS